MSASTLLLIVVATAALVVGWLIVVFNSLIALRNRVDEAWSDIDVQLKRRYDLIPNLVETVKGYARHESETMEKVINARAAAMGAQSAQDKAEAENALTSTLKSLFAIAENYPDLKASQNFLQLQDELKDAEDKIQAARRFYNANVRDLNIKIEIFPNRLIAQRMNFKKYDFFEIADEKEREAVKVRF